MDSDQILEKLSTVLKRHWLPLSLAILGLIFLGYGLIALGGNNQKNDDIVFESAGHNSAPGFTQDDKEKEGKKITVDIEGAVQKPGVYDLASDARIQDALIAARGLSDKADREKVCREAAYGSLRVCYKRAKRRNRSTYED